MAPISRGVGLKKAVTSSKVHGGISVARMLTYPRKHLLRIYAANPAFSLTTFAAAS